MRYIEEKRERLKGHDKLNGSTMEAYCELAEQITTKLHNDQAGTEENARQDGNADKAERSVDGHLAEIH